MDVDVDLVRRKVDEDNGGRSAVSCATRVGLPQGIGDRGRGRGTSVDKDVLVAARRCRQVGLFDKSRNSNGVEFSVFRLPSFDSLRALKELVAEEVVDAVGKVRCGGKFVEFASVDGQGECDRGVGEGMDREDLLDVTLLRRVGAEELTTCGDVAEEVPDFDACAGRTSGGTDLGERSGVDLDRRSFVRIGAAGRQCEARDGGNRGDGLAAEAERVDLLDIGDVVDLRGGLALQRKDGIVLCHAAAVVLHGDELAAALCDGDGDSPGSGVNRVFHEFLDDGGGALDDFARGDFVRHEEWEDPHVSITVRDQG